MVSLVERLEEEEGVNVGKLGVWHNEVNAKLMKEYDKGYCGGVPFFSIKKQESGFVAQQTTND
jgi:hypothetical protein